MAIRERRHFFARSVQRTKNERLTRRLMSGTMSGGENPRPATRKDLGPMSSRRPQRVSSRRGTHRKITFGVRGGDDVIPRRLRRVARVQGSRRRGGMSHGEVALGRGGVQLVVTRSRGGQE